MENTGIISPTEEQDLEFEKNKKQINENIGALVVTFENLMLALKQGIKVIAEKNGIKNEDLIEILIHDAGAQSLLKYFKCFMLSAFPNEMNDTEFAEKMETIYKEMQEAIEYRNSIVHASWNIGYAIDVNTFGLTSYLSAIRKRIQKNVLTNVYKDSDFKKIEEIKEHSIKNAQLFDFFMVILLDIRFSRPLVRVKTP